MNNFIKPTKTKVFITIVLFLIGFVYSFVLSQISFTGDTTRYLLIADLLLGPIYFLSNYLKNLIILIPIWLLYVYLFTCSIVYLGHVPRPRLRFLPFILITFISLLFAFLNSDFKIPPSSSARQWQTFTDHGIEIRIPPHWSKPKITKATALSTTMEFNVGLTIETKLQYLDDNSFNILIDEYSKSINKSPDEINLGQVTGKRFFIQTSVDTDKIIIFAKGRNIWVVISYPNLWNPEINTIDQILSSFRFLDTSDENEARRKSCESAQGYWLEEYNECASPGGNYFKAGYDEECLKLGGKFQDCVSPCRHDPNPKYCPEVCVQVCKF